MKNRNFAEIQKLHVKPKLHGDPETSKYNRNFTKTPKLHSITESSRKTGNPTKNPKLYGKHKLHGKTKTLHDSRSLRKT